MGAIADIWKSERGLLAVVLIISATVLAAMGQMTEASWREFSIYVFTVYVGSKTVTGSVALIKGKGADVDPAQPAPSPTPSQGS